MGLFKYLKDKFSLKKEDEVVIENKEVEINTSDKEEVLETSQNIEEDEVLIKSLERVSQYFKKHY